MTRDLTSPETSENERKGHSMWYRLLIYVFFLAAVLLWETHDQLELGSVRGFAWAKAPCDAPTSDAATPFYAPMYSLLLNRAQKNAGGFVSVVRIEQDNDIQGSLCKGRVYMAELIEAIAEQQPAAIVIDKYYSSGTCQLSVRWAPESLRDPAIKSDLDATHALEDAVHKLTVPVIIGESTDPSQRGEVDGSCLVKKGQLPLESSRIAPGLLRLNVNKEQIPLQWGVLPSMDARTAEKKDSLALAAMKLAATLVYAPHHFQESPDGMRQPYARISDTVIKSSQTSTNLLCYAKRTTFIENWKVECASVRPVSLAGQIVVVGAENDVDHPIVLGRRRWGFELQAMYIEALLSGNYLQAVSERFTLVLLVLFLVVLEVVPIRFKYCYRKKHRRLPRLCHDVPLTLIVGLVCFVLSVLLPYLIRYLPPVPLVTGIVVGTGTRMLFSYLERAKEGVTAVEEEAQR